MCGRERGYGRNCCPVISLRVIACGAHPEAGAAALPVPEGATREMVELGQRIYRGEVGRAACTGCHGESGEGTPLGPALTGKKWLWSDGSYAGIKKTIAEGVPQPRQYRSPMPPKGGAQLTPDQVSALAAYVWGLATGRSPIGTSCPTGPISRSNQTNCFQMADYPASEALS
jgi:mono/diheme cytochrome c family protein